MEKNFSKSEKQLQIRCWKSSTHQKSGVKKSYPSRKNSIKNQGSRKVFQAKKIISKIYDCKKFSSWKNSIENLVSEKSFKSEKA